MKWFYRGCLAASFLGCVTVVSASPVTTIDFEGLASMTSATGNAVPDSAKLSNQLVSTYGVVFASGDPWVAVVKLGHTTSGVNGLGGSRDNGTLTYSKAFPISFEFFDPFNTAAKATTDFVSLRGDLAGSGLRIFLRAYDLSGNQIAETSVIDVGGDTLSISAQGIHSARFFGTSDIDGGVVVDDFSYGQLTSVKQEHSVPEPSTLALALPLVGLLWVKRGIRRRARSTTN